ncbi:MAG: hypothetical protein NVSMB1_06450 [Polyangiales bacterium]
MRNQICKRKDRSRRGSEVGADMDAMGKNDKLMSTLVPTPALGTRRDVIAKDTEKIDKDREGLLLAKKVFRRSSRRTVFFYRRGSKCGHNRLSP